MAKGWSVSLCSSSLSSILLVSEPPRSKEKQNFTVFYWHWWPLCCLHSFPLVPVTVGRQRGKDQPTHSFCSMVTRGWHRELTRWDHWPLLQCCQIMVSSDLEWWVVWNAFLLHTCVTGSCILVWVVAVHLEQWLSTMVLPGPLKAAMRCEEINYADKLVPAWMIPQSQCPAPV